MPMDDLRGKIRDAVVAQCDPYQFDEPWGFLPAHDDVRCLPVDSAMLVTALRETYSEDALIEAGVAERDENGSLRIRGKLNAPEKLVVILRDRQTHAVVDMLTEMGSVFEEDLPIFNASVGDQLLLAPDNEQYEVLVVFSIEDLGVLRACGIPATLATGLECLRPADVDRLCETFGLGRRKSSRIKEIEFDSDEEEEDEESSGVFDPMRNRSGYGVTGRDVDADGCRPNESTAEEGNGVVSKDAPKGKRMVLVAWSPAKLERERPPGFDAVTNNFKELNQYVGVDIYRVHAWLATPGDIERLGFGMRYRDAGFVHEVLLDSLFDHMHRLEHLGREQTKQRTVATDFPVAVLDLRDALFAEDWEMDSANRRREALRHAERLLHQQVVKPMMDEAMACSSVRERAVGLAAAQLVQRFVIQGVAINARMTKMISQKGMDGVDAVPLEEIKAFLGVGDHLTKLFREIDRCRESSVSVIQEITVPEPKPLALLRFD